MSHTTTLPYEDLFNFLAKANQWLNKSPQNDQTKLGYAISRVTPRVQKALEKAQRKHQNRIEQLRIAACEVDDKGVVRKDDQGGYYYTREKLSQLKQQEAEAVEKLLESEIQVQTYYATLLPVEPLTAAEVDSFVGIVIEPFGEVEGHEQHTDSSVHSAQLEQPENLPA